MPLQSRSHSTASRCFWDRSIRGPFLTGGRPMNTLIKPLTAALLTSVALAGGARGQATGACCTAGVCTIETQTSCRGIFQETASCSSDPCAVVGVCCRGATCNATFVSANCSDPPGAAGAQFVPSGACNAPGND